MKKEELTALGLSGEQTEKVFALYGRDIEKQKALALEAKGQNKELALRLSTAGERIKELERVDVDTIKRTAQEWKKRYDCETAALRGQLEEKDYRYAVERATRPLRFTSEGAKRSFLADLDARKLSVEDGKLVEFDAFLAAYRELDAGAFEPEVKAPRVIFAARESPAGGNLELVSELAHWREEAGLASLKQKG